MTQDITASDHFCGAGGASIGLVAAGVRVTDAANHWPVACAVYNQNNPDTRVHCADLSATHPSRFPRTDMGWFSPECRTFSQSAPPLANRMPELFDESPDSNVQRSRVSMADVIKFTDYHRYDIVMVENVHEVNRKYPIAWWFAEMEKLGYDYRALSVNSMVCWPTPQSRDRWYACFWRKGNRAPNYEIRPKSWCPSCEAEVEAYQWWKKAPVGDPRQQHGKYRQQYIYKCSRCNTQALPYVWPALAALDLSIPCPRIGDRETPLAPATMRRIEAGLEKFGPLAIVQNAGHTYERPGYYRTWPAWRPLNAMTATNQFGIAVNTQQSGSPPRYDASRCYPFEGLLPTQTGNESLALVVPLAHGETGPRATPAGWPQGTQTGRAENGMVVVPMRTNGHAGPADGEPWATLTTAHGGGQTVVELPFLVDGGKGEYPAQPAAGPGQSVTGWGSQFVVALRNHGEARPGAEPAGAFTADGNHHGVLVRMNGDVTDAETMATPWDGPAGTVTGAANQAVVPFLSNYYGNARPGYSGPYDPVPTQLSHDHHAVVDPGIRAEDCGFRMMEPHEAGAAMAFPERYKVEGSKRTRVRLYGQAVTPPVSAEISARGIESLAG